MTERSRQRPRLPLTDHRIAITDALLVALTALALVGVVPRSPVSLLALAYATVGVLGAIVMARVRNRYRGFVTALADARTQPVDLPYALVPPEVAKVIEELGGLGFAVVGAVDTAVAGRPDFRSWILVEPSGDTWIEVGDAGHAIAVVISGTPSGRQVESAWPGGMAIDEPELLAAPASATLAQTIADHRSRLVTERRAQLDSGVGVLDPDRPDGWRIRTLDDYLAWEPVQRRRTGGLRLKTDLRTRIEPAVRLWATTAAVGLGCGVLLNVVP